MNEAAEPTRVPVYDFEFKLIPAWIYGLLDKVNSVDKLLLLLGCKEWFIDSFHKLNAIPDFSWNDFDIKLFNTIDGSVILYTFPHPSRQSLAKYGAIVASGNQLAYYTLEKSERINFAAVLLDKAAPKSEESWILGSVSQSGHATISSAPACNSPLDFIKLLQEQGKVSKLTQSDIKEPQATQQRNKYHVSDDGKVYRINDDGSFTSVGSIEDIEANRSKEDAESQSVDHEVGWWKRNYNWLWSIDLILLFGWCLFSCSWAVYSEYIGDWIDRTVGVSSISAVIVLCYGLSWYWSSSLKPELKYIPIILWACACLMALKVFNWCEYHYMMTIACLALIPFALWAITLHLRTSKRK